MGESTKWTCPYCWRGEARARKTTVERNGLGQVTAKRTRRWCTACGAESETVTRFTRLADVVELGARG